MRVIVTPGAETPLAFELHVLPLKALVGGSTGPELRSAGLRIRTKVETQEEYCDSPNDLGLQLTNT